MKRNLRRWWSAGLAGTMLGLSLFCGGCASAPRAGVALGPAGNAVVMLLPAGSVIGVRDAGTAVVMGAAFLNELNNEWTQINTNGGVKLELVKTLVVSTLAYIAERDQRELELMKEIERLKTENTGLRLR